MHIHPIRCANLTLNTANGIGKMSASSIEQKALGLLTAIENTGKTVSRISIDGRKIEIVLAAYIGEDEFEGIDMQHGKTRVTKTRIPSK